MMRPQPPSDKSFFETKEPSVIIQFHSRGQHTRQEKRRILREASANGTQIQDLPKLGIHPRAAKAHVKLKDGETAMIPVMRRRGTHVNTRHNAEYIPPRRKEVALVTKGGKA